MRHQTKELVFVETESLFFKLLKSHISERRRLKLAKRNKWSVKDQDDRVKIERTDQMS